MNFQAIYIFKFEYFCNFQIPQFLGSFFYKLILAQKIIKPLIYKDDQIKSSC